MSEQLRGADGEIIALAAVAAPVQPAAEPAGHAVRQRGGAAAAGAGAGRGAQPGAAARGAAGGAVRPRVRPRRAGSKLVSRAWREARELFFDDVAQLIERACGHRRPAVAAAVACHPGAGAGLFRRGAGLVGAGPDGGAGAQPRRAALDGMVDGAGAGADGLAGAGGGRTDGAHGRAPAQSGAGPGGADASAGAGGRTHRQCGRRARRRAACRVGQSEFRGADRLCAGGGQGASCWARCCSCGSASRAWCSRTGTTWRAGWRPAARSRP